MKHISLVLAILIIWTTNLAAQAETSALQQPFGEPTIQAGSGTAFGEKVIQHQDKKQKSKRTSRQSQSDYRYNAATERSRTTYIDRTQVNRPYTGIPQRSINMNQSASYGRTGSPIPSAATASAPSLGTATLAIPGKHDVNISTGAKEVTDDEIVEIGPINNVPIGNDGSSKKPDDYQDASAPLTDAIPLMILLSGMYISILYYRNTKKTAAK